MEKVSLYQIYLVTWNSWGPRDIRIETKNAQKEIKMESPHM